LRSTTFVLCGVKGVVGDKRFIELERIILEGMLYIEVNLLTGIVPNGLFNEIFKNSGLFVTGVDPSDGLGN
jgi:hypothetical protein